MHPDPVRIPRRGPLPSPRVSLRASFLFAVAESSFQRWELANLAGFRHPQTFSKLLHMPAVPLSYAPLLQKVALLVGHNADIFIDRDEIPRLVKQAVTDDAVAR